MKFNTGDAVLHGQEAWQVISRDTAEGTYVLRSLDNRTEVEVKQDQVLRAP